MAAPAPVTVHCEVGVRWPPYSSGKRYCRSAEQKCEPVTAQAECIPPEAMSRDASDSDSVIVEHAPYSPKYGTELSFIAKAELTHWFRRSPEKTASSAVGEIPPLRQAVSKVCFIMRLSAFSQLLSPK